MMAMREDYTSPQQDTSTFSQNLQEALVWSEYVKRYETEEYVTHIYKGEIDPEQERPSSFPSEVIPFIRRVELAAKNIGKLIPVKIQIDRARKESPAFETIYQGTEKQQESKEDATKAET